MSTKSWQLSTLDMNLSSTSSSSPDKMEEKLHISSRESSGVICLQVLPSYLLAGLGMVTAGMLLDQVQVSHTTTHKHCPSCPSFHHRAPSRIIYPSGIRGKPWQQHDYRRLSSDKHSTSHRPPAFPSHSIAAWTDIQAFPPVKMRKGLQSSQVHAEHQHSEEKEREVWKEKEEKEEKEKERQHRRAEKKLLAFWMSLSHRTWTLFRPRERPAFQRSASSARLLKSEA